MNEPPPTSNFADKPTFTDKLARHAREGQQRATVLSHNAAQGITRRAQQGREAASPWVSKGREAASPWVDRGREQATQSWRQASTQVQSTARSGARAAQQFSHRAQQTVAEKTRIEHDEFGRMIRPLTVKAAAGLGVASAVMVLGHLIFCVFPFFSRIRHMARAAEEAANFVESNAGISIAATIAGVSQRTQTMLAVLTVAFVVVAVVGYGLYTWRVLHGRGRARIVAIALSLFLIPPALMSMPGVPTLPPLIPIQARAFTFSLLALLCGIASIIAAFLPQSSAWFRRADRTAPEPTQARGAAPHPAPFPPPGAPPPMPPGPPPAMPPRPHQW